MREQRKAVAAIDIPQGLVVGYEDGIIRTWQVDEAIEAAVLLEEYALQPGSRPVSPLGSSRPGSSASVRPGSAASARPSSPNEPVKVQTLIWSVTTGHSPAVLSPGCGSANQVVVVAGVKYTLLYYLSLVLTIQIVHSLKSLLFRLHKTCEESILNQG